MYDDLDEVNEIEDKTENSDVVEKPEDSITDIVEEDADSEIFENKDLDVDLDEEIMEDEYNNVLNNTFVTDEEGNRFRTDDNGDIYSERNNETKQYENIPNTTYELNGYTYETDDLGRISKVCGTLQENNHESRKTINDRVEDMIENDERGHIIGDQFNGSNLNGNLVAMDFNLNRGEYKKLEEEWAKYVNEDMKNVDVNIEMIYPQDGKRPSEMKVKYFVDGEEFSHDFKNGSDGK